MVQARSNAEPRIKTTVVGSYPFPDWLAALPSEQALLDATRVVIHTQEQAGIDLVCDGELSRFDVNHPETNGMIEYFVRPMAGIRTAMRFDELIVLPRATRDGLSHRGRRRSSMARSAPARSTCRRPARAPSGLPAEPFKFTLTGPHMLAKTLLDHHYGSVPELAMAIADALAEQVRAARRRRGADRRGKSAWQSGRMGVGRAGDQPRAARGEDRSSRASVLRQLRRPVDPERDLGQADRLSQRARGRPYRDGNRAPAARRNSRSFAAYGRRSGSASASSTSNRPRSSAPTISPARSNEPRKSSGRAASPTSIPTAGSGCSSAISPTASCVRW